MVPAADGEVEVRRVGATVRGPDPAQHLGVLGVLGRRQDPDQRGEQLRLATGYAGLDVVAREVTHAHDPQARSDAGLGRLHESGIALTLKVFQRVEVEAEEPLGVPVLEAETRIERHRGQLLPFHRAEDAPALAVLRRDQALHAGEAVRDVAEVVHAGAGARGREGQRERPHEDSSERTAESDL